MAWRDELSTRLMSNRTRHTSFRTNLVPVSGEGEQHVTRYHQATYNNYGHRVRCGTRYCHCSIYRFISHILALYLQSTFVLLNLSVILSTLVLWKHWFSIKAVHNKKQKVKKKIHTGGHVDYLYLIMLCPCLIIHMTLHIVPEHRILSVGSSHSVLLWERKYPKSDIHPHENHLLPTSTS